jgi:hypothetical protein
MEKTERRTQFASDTRISFIDDGLLLASFWTDSRPGGCTWKKKPVPDRCHLHAVEIEVPTGRVRSTHEWSFPFSDAVIYPARQGKFILSTENELRLYSPDFAELRKVVLPVDGPARAIVLVRVSPTGRTLLAGWPSRKTLLQPSSGKSTSRTKQEKGFGFTGAVFETDDLKERQRWEAEKAIPASVSDSLVVALVPDFIPFVTSQHFLIRGFDEQKWHDVYATKDWFSSTATLLNDQFLVVRERDRVALLNTEGTELSEDTDFRKKEYPTWNPVTSADGLRFAVGVAVDRARPFWASPVSVETRLVVYDVPQRSPVYILPLDTAPGTGKLWVLHEFALSPAGALLVHSANGFVELYRLPPSRTRQSAP